jgi:hypothetical protein
MFQSFRWAQLFEWCEQCAVAVVFVEFLLGHGLRSISEVCSTLRTAIAEFKELVREVKK